jgi:hypothetical protein
MKYQSWENTHSAMRSNIEQKEAIIDKLIEENGMLLEACKAMIARLDTLTTDEFSKGGEKAEREMMIAAIAKAEGK